MTSIINYSSVLKKGSPIPSRGLTRIPTGDINITMDDLKKLLRELIKEKGLRKTARQLGVDHASLYRSLDSDLRWSRIKSILDLLGYEFKIVKKGGEKQSPEEPIKKKGGD